MNQTTPTPTDRSEGEKLDGYAGLYTTEEVISFIDRVQKANKPRRLYSRFHGGDIDNNIQEDVDDEINLIRSEISND